MNKRILSGLVFSSLFAVAHGQSESVVKMAEVTVYSPRVANQDPSGTFAMPVSVLRFDPRADVQARNLAEGQADVSIRGGTFENTSFKLGALALYDPQTGHYYAEIPVAPFMLGMPEVLTGADNAVSGFNANVGTVSYSWRPVTTAGAFSIAQGEYSTNRQDVYQGYSKTLANGAKLGVDGAFSHSESDGSLPFGDHRFFRYSGRFQLISNAGQTDLVAGYQSKFFGWPNMYTPFGYNETENLQTVLTTLNHKKVFGGGDYVQAGAFWRRNKDDYEFNRAVPGASNPFQHTTWVYGASVDGRNSVSGEALAINYSASAMFDHLKSTSLTYGRFNNRNYYKASLVPETNWALDNSHSLKLKAGATWDDTNRDDNSVSPVAELSLLNRRGGSAFDRLYISYSEASQVASYTALNSAPNSGLFRGNANLGRTKSDNVEVGGSTSLGAWRAQAAVFFRRDNNLVDWTYRKGVTARTANPVDIDTTGFEIGLTRSWQLFDMTLGYTAMSKDAEYGSSLIDASFYALNYARHRMTAAFTARLGRGFELRMDNEVRVQQENYLRRSSNDAFISAVGLSYRPPQYTALVLSAQVDNIWNSDFEEVPGTPAGKRLLSFSATYTW